jgi:hypothetical protein
MRPEPQAIGNVEDPARVGGRRLRAPVVDVEALVRAEGRRLETMRDLERQREATARQRELLEGPLEQAVRVDVVDRRPLRDVRPLDRREHRDVAIRLRLIAVLDDGAERERGQRGRPDHLIEPEEEAAALERARERGEGRSAATARVVAVAVAQEERRVLLVEVVADVAGRSVREVVGLARCRGGEADAEIARLVARGERSRVPHLVPAPRGGGDDVDGGRRHDVDEVAPGEGRAVDHVLDGAADGGREDRDVIAVGVRSGLERHALLAGVLGARRGAVELGGARRDAIAAADRRRDGVGLGIGGA